MFYSDYFFFFIQSYLLIIIIGQLLISCGGLTLLLQRWQKDSFKLKRLSSYYNQVTLGFYYLISGLTVILIRPFMAIVRSGEAKFVIEFFIERFNIFSFVITPLNFFFLLLNFTIMMSVILQFRLTAMDERVHSVEFLELQNHKNFRELIFNLLITFLSFLLTIFFTTQNIFIFFITFEASVLPIFIIMSFFGKRSQKFKAIQYLLYFTIFSGIPFLMTIFFIYRETGSVFYPELVVQILKLSAFKQLIIFIGCFIPFSVKFAFFPLHTWLPEAHVEASTEGSMLLSGIMLKLGFFGIMQYCLGFTKSVIFIVAAPLLTLAFIGGLATTFSTFQQLDLKKIIAYSSVVHMNLSLFGYLTLSSTALQAALFMNLSHAFISIGLFSLVGLLQERTRTRNILELSGLSTALPVWSNLFLILLLANAGLPGTVGFIAEAPLIWGCFQYFPYTGLLLLIPLNIMALRNFLLYAQVCWGVTSSYLNPMISINNNTQDYQFFRSWDINLSGEGVVPFMLAVFSIILGVNPSLFLSLLEYSSFFFIFLNIFIYHDLSK